MNIGRLNTFGHNSFELRNYDSQQFKHKNVPSIEYYLKQLNYFYTKGKGFLKSLNFGFIRNKFRRSERREGTYLVLSHILNHLNLASWAERGGKAMETYAKFTISSLAHSIGLSWSRVQRAITDLVKAEFILGEDHYFKGGFSKTTFVVLNKLFKELNIRKEDLIKTVRFAETSKKLKKREESYAKNNNDNNFIHPDNISEYILSSKDRKSQPQNNISDPPPKNSLMHRLTSIQQRFSVK